MGTKKFVVLTAMVGMLSVPAVASANCEYSRSDTCDPKTEDTFTLAGRCWQAKCEGKVETPLDFVVTANPCLASLELHANATITSCTTLQLADNVADINSIKTECDGVGGVQKVQIKAVDKYPANGMAEVGCLSDDECCGEATCGSGTCCLPGGAACSEDSECCSDSCSGVCDAATVPCPCEGTWGTIGGSKFTLGSASDPSIIWYWAGTPTGSTMPWRAGDGQFTTNCDEGFDPYPGCSPTCGKNASGGRSILDISFQEHLSCAALLQ